MSLSPLAHQIMLIAAEYNVQPGQPLPEAAFDLLLTQKAEHIGDALLELYTEDLLEEVPYEMDILTVKGFEYISRAFIRQLY